MTHNPLSLGETPAVDRPLVLIVDDYSDAREMYADYFEVCGFRVAQACDGLEAIKKAREVLPDAILMDLSLPVLDGWEATRRLKQDERTRHIPVVALSGYASLEHSDDAKSAGCDAFVVKPCVPEELIRQVKRILQAREIPSLVPRPSSSCEGW